MIKRCSISGCIGPVIARQLCHKHYKRWQTNGHTELTQGKGCRDPLERIRFQTRRVASGCLEWTGVLTPGGYGKTKWNYKDYAAHRLVWVLTIGEIPNGMHVCHQCDNPKCVAIEHLFLGTCKDNKQDSVSKGRHAFGERVGTAKLTWDRVKLIQNSEAGATYLAKFYGVNRSVIHAIRTGRRWNIPATMRSQLKEIISRD